MRITKIKVNNFKSLVDFEIDLSKFNCIVGLNGSGKSTFLQFIDFLGFLVNSTTFERRFASQDLYADYTPFRYHLSSGDSSISFEVEIEDNDGSSILWNGVTSQGRRFLESERIVTNDESLVRNGNSYSLNKTERSVDFIYEGSILSRIDPSILPPAIIRLKHFIENIRVFDPFSPERMKVPSPLNRSEMKANGEGLSGFLSSLHPDRCEKIVKQLQILFPNIKEVDIPIAYDENKPVGRRFVIGEEYLHDIDRPEIYKTESLHVNDGLVRMLGILSQLQSDQTFLLFDEIENGINQELVEFLLKELVEAKQQIVVTTHSGLFLNYLDDDLARDSVQYFYKTPQGFTRCKKFFSIPSTAKKLGSLGPGEAVDDTNLYRLNEEIEQLDRNKEKGG